MKTFWLPKDRITSRSSNTDSAEHHSRELHLQLQPRKKYRVFIPQTEVSVSQTASY